MRHATVAEGLQLTLDAHAGTRPLAAALPQATPQPGAAAGDANGGVCEGCGRPLAPPRGPGRRPKWHSQRCRKQTLYHGVCVDCGARTNGYGGPGTAAQRCRACSRAHRHALREWTPAAIVTAIQHWALERGQPPTAEQWKREGRPSLGTIVKECGSWNAAIAAAGYQPTPRGQRRRRAARGRANSDSLPRE